MQLNNLVFSVVSSTVQVSVTFILGLILGCIYEWSLTLIMFICVPFIAVVIVMRKSINSGSGKRGVKVNVEEGCILSECVTNNKTIHSYNFQNHAVDMYMNNLEYNRKKFLKNSNVAGFFVGLGQLIIFAGNTAVFHAVKIYILDGDIDSEDMALTLNIILTSAGSIGNGLGQLGDIKKALITFKSIYSTLDQPVLINPFRRDNADKISALKIELRHVYFSYPTRPEQVILKDVSFTIFPGQQVGLVGYSGSGKSTIIQLLTRFYDVEDGKGEILR